VPAHSKPQVHIVQKTNLLQWKILPHQQFLRGLNNPPKKKSFSVAVVGFCVWGANGVGIFVWGTKWGLSAKGVKLRLPKARSPSRLGSGGAS